MRAITLAFLFLLPGVVDAQQASYTYINQKPPYKNLNPPMLTALNLPRINAKFQVRVPAAYSTPTGKGEAFLATGVANPNVVLPTLRGFLFTTADHLMLSPRSKSWVTVTFSIPNSPVLVGGRFYQQVLAVRYDAPYGPCSGGCPFLSRGGVGVIGR